MKNCNKKIRKFIEDSEAVQGIKFVYSRRRASILIQPFVHFKHVSEGRNGGMSILASRASHTENDIVI